MRTLVLFVACLFAWYLARAENTSQQLGKGDVEHLKSPEVSERVDARAGIYRQRVEPLRGLRHLAASGATGVKVEEGRQYTSPKYLAVVLLGELRDEGAVPVLVRNIAWRVPNPFAGVASKLIWGQFPAAVSLAKIGTPALDEVLAILHTTRNPLERHLCVWILVQIEGAERTWGREVAKFRVEKAIERCKSSEMKANLEAALEYFDKPDLDFAPPEESEKMEGK